MGVAMWVIYGGLVMRNLKILATALAAAVLASLLFVAPASAASPTGHKHITASVTADNKISVKWGATTGVKYYKVKTSSTPDMSDDVKSYKTTKTSIVVKATKYASVASGNYTFVRVYAVKKNGKVGESPYRAVRLNPVVPAAGGAAVTVATFNVRTAEKAAEKKTPTHKWAKRISKVASQIQSSGAAVIGLQEAGASTGRYSVVTETGADGKKHSHKDIYWQFEELRDKAGSQYALADSDEYSLGSGKEGTRILYDTTKVTLLEQGHFAPSAVNSKLRFVPWAKFQDNATGKTFYFISVHLAANEDDTSRSDSSFSKLRVKQIAKVTTYAKKFAATGNQVIVVGDMNSNIYSAPNNAVDRKLISAGFYDASATTNYTNEFFVTYNAFKKSKSSASRTDYILTIGGPKGAYSFKNWIVKSGTIPSDHNMQSATLPF
jgi:endonuclease/exonuclease/phosphatase family metal-dependent hydrolase